MAMHPDDPSPVRASRPAGPGLITSTRRQASSHVAAGAPNDAGDATGLRPLSDTLDDQLIWGLVDAAPDGIILADEAGHILLVNRRTEELFGCDRGELLGQTVEELLPQRSRAVHRAHRTRYRAEPRPRAMGAGLQLFGQRVDGTEFPVEISLSPIHTESDVKIIATVRDITERVALEAAAHEVREVLDATRDAISIFDAQTLRFTYVNQGLVDQLGYSSEQLLVMTMLHIAPEFTEAALRQLLAPFEDGQTSVTTFQTLHRRRDGSDLPVEVLLQAIPDDDGSPRSYVKIARDITERLEADARQQRTQHDLRVLEDRERMARDLHDLVIQRLFATGMSLQGVMALSDPDEHNRRVQRAVDDIDETIREIRTAIFGLQTPITRDGGGLREQILVIIDDERPALGFAPHISFDGVIDGTDETVAHHLLAVLRELLSNVARHAHATSVEILIHGDEDSISVRVTDDGVGIAPALDGRGNGLRNMHERARTLGGTFTIGAATDGGTISECRLPRATS